MLRYLQTGSSIFGEVERLPEETRREAWDTARDDILADHIQESPGSRPFAWWRYEAKQQRRQVAGPAHSRPDSQRWFGVPTGMYCPSDFEAEYETEAEYLERLHLLQPGERKAMACRNNLLHTAEYSKETD
jgi:hypothetical protein